MKNTYKNIVPLIFLFLLIFIIFFIRRNFKKKVDDKYNPDRKI